MRPFGSEKLVIIVDLCFCYGHATPLTGCLNDPIFLPVRRAAPRYGGHDMHRLGRGADESRPAPRRATCTSTYLRGGRALARHRRR